MCVQTLLLRCVDCKHIFTISCPVVIEDGKEVVKVGAFDDLCPLCELQGEFVELAHDFFKTASRKA